MLYRTPIYVNAFNLSILPGVAIYNHDFINMPSRILNRQKLARSDRSLLTSAEYSEKIITITGIVTGNTLAQIESRFETLKGIMQIPESTIRVEQGGLQVNYTGTLSAITKQYQGKHLKFTLNVLCSNPIGRDQLVTELLNLVNTSATTTQTLTIEGSYKAHPIITVTIGSLTGGTNKTIQVLNSDTTQGITVQRDWTAGEILTVDSFNRIVEVDDVEVDYGGIFPTFYPGTRAFQYIDDLTTRSVTIHVQYNKQFA